MSLFHARWEGAQGRAVESRGNAGVLCMSCLPTFFVRDEGVLVHGMRRDTAMESMRYTPLPMRASPQSGPMPLSMRKFGSAWGGRCSGSVAVVARLSEALFVLGSYAVAAAGVCGRAVASGRVHRGPWCDGPRRRRTR